MPIIGRTLPVKLSEGDVNEMDTALFFQCGDWAVTQGICVFHQNACFKVTHVPSTCCIPHCFADQKRAENLARDLNMELPKFKRAAGAPAKYHDHFKRALERNGIRLVPKSESAKAPTVSASI